MLYHKRIKVAHISYFFTSKFYRVKIKTLSSLYPIDNLVIVPKGWKDNFVALEVESEKHGVNEYAFLEERTFLNWSIWGEKRWHLFILSPSLVQHLHEFSPDIIDLDMEPYSLLALETAIIRNLWLKNCKLVIHSSQNIYKKFPKPFSWTEQFVLKNSDMAMVRSKEVGNVMSQKGCRCPMHVVPHGVDTTKFHPADNPLQSFISRNQKSKKFVIGYVGALAIHKGVDCLLEAASLLEFPFKILIVGDGPERIPLETLSVKLGIRPYVDFLGTIPHIEMINFFHQLDVLVLPSITMWNWKEQFGRVIIEAMACGLPVVGSNSGEIPAVIGDGGFIFKEKKSDELATILRNLYCNKELWLATSKKARQRAEKYFSWEVVASQVYSLYQECMK
jgi:glycosyltransferase involved in cell wall biosynthesis